jgi:transposase-like protein
VKHSKSPFKWRHFEPSIILLCVRWYCRYQLSYRDLEEMMRERDLSVDHRFIRRRWRAAQCFRSFHSAERTLEGVKSMHMIRKGQVKRLDGRDTAGQAKFVAGLFGVAA